MRSEHKCDVSSHIASCIAKFNQCLSFVKEMTFRQGSSTGKHAVVLAAQIHFVDASLQPVATALQRGVKNYHMVH